MWLCYNGDPCGKDTIGTKYYVIDGGFLVECVNEIGDGFQLL